MRKNLKWLITVAVLTLGLVGLTACGGSTTSDEAEDSAKVTDPVKVTCENGVMLGQS